MTAATTTAPFDAHGRLIPQPGEMVYSQADRRYFRLSQPPLDLGAIHGRFAAQGLAPIDAAAFAARATALRATIEADASLAGLLAGVHVPFLLPAAPAGGDLGAELEAGPLRAAAASFTATLPKYEFRNHLDQPMAGQVAVEPGVRYERLLAARAAGPVVGWYFPTAMTGYAVPQQRETIARLPEAAILSGPLEVASAFVGTPDLLHHDTHYPNGLALSAVTPPDEDFFYFFEAYGWNLTFNRRSMVGAVSEYFSGGVTILDQP